MVAMKLVDRMERDVLQAEWEDWVFRESARCQRAKALIDKTYGGRDNETEAHQKWWSGYCDSCLKAAEDVAEGTKI